MDFSFVQSLLDGIASLLTRNVVLLLAAVTVVFVVAMSLVFIWHWSTYATSLGRAVRGQLIYFIVIGVMMAGFLGAAGKLIIDLS